ncbi:MAG: hypothetical protein Q4C36_09705 [Coriobacteriia bacterium]|nr:hypothetical protein [Coriobacteriia bacterium]
MHENEAYEWLQADWAARICTIIQLVNGFDLKNGGCELPDVAAIVHKFTFDAESTSFRVAP